VRIIESTTQRFARGRTFGRAGSYQLRTARVEYSINANDRDFDTISDLAMGPIDLDGSIRFTGDIYTLEPTSAARRSNVTLFDVPNRGFPMAFRLLAMGSSEISMDCMLNPGDGYILESGWTICWCGWQVDVPNNTQRLGLQTPTIPVSVLPQGAKVRVRLLPSVWTDSLPLFDTHIGGSVDLTPVPPLRNDDPDDRLFATSHPSVGPQEVERSRWHFSGEDISQVVLEGGFEPGVTYDIVYRPRESKLAGLGLIALRDSAHYMRQISKNSKESPVVLAFGHSQAARFLREFLFLGLNLDKLGSPIFDGMLIHAAGSRRGDFNRRFAQPSVQSTPGPATTFPFADLAQEDPLSGGHSGLLDRQQQRGGVPKIIYTNTSSEYWRGDGMLAHLDLNSMHDAPEHPHVRRYLFASTQHDPGVARATRTDSFGRQGLNLMNLIDYRPLLRASLSNLLEWVVDNVSPPESVVPSVAENSATERASLFESFTHLGLSVPDGAGLSATEFCTSPTQDADDLVDLLPDRACVPYPALVSVVDHRGNEQGGVRMPDVSVAIAVHVGFNPAHTMTASGIRVPLEYAGSSEPLGPPGAAGSLDTYLKAVSAAAWELVDRRLLLARDVKLCGSLARDRYLLFHDP
jgi:hypothetical protein